MKTSLFILIIVSLLCNSAFADRTLSAGEINVILNALTQQPVGTWLPAGSISARRLEYSMTEKSICEYHETAHFDGLRFYREVTLISGENETESDVGTEKQNAMDMDRERIFCWDGVTYTQYYKSAASAVIQSGQNHTPFGTYGPFSAGIIPWGHGVYTLQKLSGCICTAHEVGIEDQRQIHLQVTDENSSPQLQMNFVLDPAKNYAVISHRIEDPQLSGINQSYSQFVQVNDRWIPTVITIERFLKKPEGHQVLSYEDWTFEAIKPDVPLDAHFSVKPKNNTLVELHSSNQSKSLMYYVNDQKDIASLLEEKNAFLTPLGSVEKNCAAAAIQLVTKQFSRPYPASQIETLTVQNSKMTSLYLLKSKLEETGLYCAAVETTLESLRKINNSQVILHLQDNSHYVILDRIDDENVWTIDLTSRKIYWKTPIQQFLRQWKRGIAIIVSDNPQNLNPEGTPLSASDQQQIMGGDTTGTNYSCNERIQTNKDLFCSEPMGFVCGGRYYTYWERYGCKEDPNGGFCVGEEMLGHEYTDCISDLGNLGSCNVTGISRLRSIRACQ